MPDSVRQYLRLSFPAGLCLALLAAASVFYGADIPAAKAIFSTAVIAIAGIAALAMRTFAIPAGVWAALALLGAFAVHHVVEGRMDTAAPEFAALAGAGAIWLIARNSAAQPDAGGALWRASIATGTAIAVWAFFDFTLGPRTGDAARLSAGFLSPNTAATFFGIVALMGLAELMKQVRRAAGGAGALARHAPGLALSLCGFLIPATCLVLTASRGGILFAAFSALALAGWQVLAMTRHGGVARRSAGLGLAVAAALAVLAGLVWTMSGELAAARYERGLVDELRLQLFEAYWQAVPLAPVSGHGLGSFRFTNDMITTSQQIRSLGATSAAHNVFLQWLLQAGWTGALAMWAVVALLIWQSARGLGIRRRSRGYLRAVLGISAFVVLHGQTDFALEVPGVMWWWAWVLGLGAGLAMAGQGARREQGRAFRPEPPPRVSRAVIVLCAGTLAGVIGWQGQMLVSANLAHRLPAGAVAAMAGRASLPPSAYLRDALAARAIESDIADLEFAARATHAALEREPRLVSAWNRLVYLDLATHGRLTDDGQAALAQSFHLSPYRDQAIIRWRLQLSAQAWEGLNPYNRQQVRSQLLAQAIHQPVWLRRFAQEAPDGFRAEVEAALERGA